MKVSILIRVFSLALLLLVSGLASASLSPDEQRRSIRLGSKSILANLYKIQPSAKKAVESAGGYAVFSNFGVKIFFAGGGTGNGIAFDRETGQETFMKMMEVQAGLGIGIKKFGLVFVFQDRQALERFAGALL